MEEPIAKANEGEVHSPTAISNKMGRKEKRKALKKMKRKQFRKEIAVREREEDETRLEDPEQQIKIRMMEQEDAARSERERKEFEEREKAWLEAVELKKKIQQQKEEELRIKALDEESRELQVQNVIEGNENDDDDWEYIEEGPAEIIWQGNEIIVKKNKVRVPKKDILGQSRIEFVSQNADRPTSNPLPPQSEAFADYSRSTSSLNVTESITQHIPKFGTEQDKAHCPFHLKTGACRFGQRCSRVHFYPDKSCTLLIKNMFSVPGLSWEQDEELEYTDEELERSYEEFYNDVHTEFLKFGEIVNFKVCRNGSFHLRGNVYVQYKSLDSALCAFQAINGRYFDGKQVRCEFVNVTRWKVAICGEYMKSRFKTCSRGTACNFIHCFRNPGRDYEWADSDKPPPRYWVKQMVALFGCSDESAYLNSSKPSTPEGSASAERHCSRRSRSLERDHLKLSSSRKKDHEVYRRSGKERHINNNEDENRNRFEDICEGSHVKDYFHGKRKTDFLGCDEEPYDNVKNVDKEDRETHQGCGRRSSTKHVKVQCQNDDYGNRNGLDKSSDRKTSLGSMRTSSRQNDKIYNEIKNHETHDDEWLDKDMNRYRHYSKRRKSSGKLIKGLKTGDNLRTNKSEERENCSSTENIKVGSPFESRRSDGYKEISRSHCHDSRYRPNMPTEENDRWEPEVCSP